MAQNGCAASVRPGGARAWKSGERSKDRAHSYLRVGASAFAKLVDDFDVHPCRLARSVCLICATFGAPPTPTRTAAALTAAALAPPALALGHPEGIEAVVIDHVQRFGRLHISDLDATVFEAD